MTPNTEQTMHCDEIQISAGPAVMKGDLCIPAGAAGLILFAHGAGSSRFSPRNKYVADLLHQADFATLLMDLLSEEEEQKDLATRKFRFDIPLLAGRVDEAITWITGHDRTASLPIGLFGASTGAAAALIAATQRPETVGAVVSRGGRPDLAEKILDRVQSPTLLIVGSCDTEVLALNQAALKKINVEKKLITVPGATHLFEEPGKLDQVAGHARNWFEQHLIGDCPPPHIDACAFGHMTVNGKEYDEDLMLFPDHIKDHWWRDEGHVLKISDLQEVIAYRPQLVVIGTGAAGRMKVQPAVRDCLHQNNIMCIEEKTADAAAVFNKKMQEGANVVGVFHLTC